MTKSSMRNYIPSIHHIPEDCEEHFLPICGELKHKGLQMAGVSDLIPPYEMSRPAEWTGIVLYTIEGQGGFNGPETSHLLTAGDLLLISPNYPHNYWADGNWKIAWFHYRPQAENYFGISSGQYELRKNIEAKQMISAMNFYISESHRTNNEGDKMMTLYGEIITTCLHRLIHPDGTDSSYGFHQERIQKIWEDVNKKLQRQWSVKELADRCNISTGHFRRVVLSLDGMSPKDKIIRLRLNRAKELITSTDMTLEQIAPLVGYTSASVLSRTFKKHLGVTPNALRRR